MEFSYTLAYESGTSSPSFGVTMRLVSVDGGKGFLQRLILDAAYRETAGITSETLQELRKSYPPKKLQRALQEFPQLQHALKGKTPGRKKQDELELLRIAAAYVKALELSSIAPYQHMEGYQDGYTLDGLRKAIGRCRAREPALLTEARNGKAGGTLTPYALELLDEL
jgi:hypothetical protein